MSGSSALVPETSLHDRYAAIVAATQNARVRLIKSDGEADVALRYFLVFSERGAAATAGLGTFSDVELFYNRYYWFKRFAKLYQAARGYDAGIEDQASQLLERAPAEVDWDVVEEISALTVQTASTTR